MMPCDVVVDATTRPSRVVVGYGSPRLMEPRLRPVVYAIGTAAVSTGRQSEFGIVSSVNLAGRADPGLPGRAGGTQEATPLLALRIRIDVLLRVAMMHVRMMMIMLMRLMVMVRRRLLLSTFDDVRIDVVRPVLFLGHRAHLSYVLQTSVVGVLLLRLATFVVANVQRRDWTAVGAPAAAAAAATVTDAADLHNSMTLR